MTREEEDQPKLLQLQVGGLLLNTGHRLLRFGDVQITFVVFSLEKKNDVE